MDREVGASRYRLNFVLASPRPEDDAAVGLHVLELEVDPADGDEITVGAKHARELRGEPLEEWLNRRHRAERIALLTRAEHTRLSA